MKSLNLILSFFLILFIQSFSLLAQCGAPPSANCQGIPASELILSTPTNVDFTFDSFSKYKGGISQSGSTILRLKVLPNNASCKWVFRVYVDNNPGGGTLATDWEHTMPPYGNSGSIPTLDLLEIRIYNGCNTPVASGIYRSFAPANGSSLDIIPTGMLIPAGNPCVQGASVNGPGSYLSNYDEYSFTIDYRIIPGLTCRPGMYQISLRFCLVEDM